MEEGQVEVENEEEEEEGTTEDGKRGELSAGLGKE